MLRLQEKLITQALRLSPEDILATICPACFGPEVLGKRPSEPNAVVCLDGNFQHRRHQAASALWRGECGLMPTLFLKAEEVSEWEIKMAKPQSGKAKVIVRVDLESFFDNDEKLYTERINLTAPL